MKKRCSKATRYSAALVLAALAWPSHASVIYTLNTGIATNVIEDAPTGFLDTPGGIDLSPGYFDRAWDASITFDQPLAAGATTKIHAERDGRGIMGSPSGGVTGFSAFSSPMLLGAFTLSTDPAADSRNGMGPLIHDPNGDIYYQPVRYPTLDGEVTTDAAGNIVDWSLEFNNYKTNISSFSGVLCVVESATCQTMSSSAIGAIGEAGYFYSNQKHKEAVLSYKFLDGIHSPRGKKDIKYVAYGMENIGQSGLIQGYVELGADNGWTRTGGPGNPVPVPGTLSLMLLAGLGMLGVRKRSAISGFAVN